MTKCIFASTLSPIIPSKSWQLYKKETQPHFLEPSRHAQEKELARWKKAYAALAGDSVPLMQDSQRAQPQDAPQFLEPTNGGRGPVITVCPGEPHSGRSTRSGPTVQPSVIVQEPDSPKANGNSQAAPQVQDQPSVAMLSYRNNRGELNQDDSALLGGQLFLGLSRN